MVKKNGAKQYVGTVDNGYDHDDDPGSSSLWLEQLSVEDRRLALAVGCVSMDELEREKAKIRGKGQLAQEHQRRQLWQNEQRRQWEVDDQKKVREQGREDRRWSDRVAEAKEVGLAEGVLLTEDFGDGKWWVKVGDAYIEGKDQYYCSLCNKHLNDVTLEHHIASENHKKKVSWNQCEASGSAGSLSAASTSASSSRPSPAHTPVSGACGKRYAPPNLAYLAYVPGTDGEECSSGVRSGERWLKCLLCQKWVGDENSHSGTFDAPSGSKEHQKNLRNYGPGNPWYDETVIGDRLKWHPGSLSRHDVEPLPSEAYASASLSWAAPAGQNHQVSGSPFPPPPPAPPVPQAPLLPPGWEMGEAAGYPGHNYYFNRSTGASQWTMPDF